VRGYIAQEGMKKDIERMRMGGIYKAMDGRVTAKRPRFGYQITHPKDSHYVLHPEESKVMRQIYEKIIYEGWTLGQIAKWLNDTGVPTRFQPGFWTASTVYALVRSPVYKGEFYAHRHYRVETGKFNEKGRPKGVMKQRPESEWIRIEVPAIVTPEEWELARETMARNATSSSRNSKKGSWLLSGFVKCAICRTYTLVAVLGNTPRKPRRYYFCSSRNSEKARGLKNACYSPYVHADELERRVWEEIESVIYDPSQIVRRLEEKMQEERTMGYEGQIDYIQKQLDGLAKEKAKFEAAYRRDIYTLDEFEEKMKDLRGRTHALELSQAKLEARLAETHSIEEQKRVVLTALAKIKAEVESAKQRSQPPDEIPYDLKRKILSVLVDVIWVDSIQKTFAIEGEIRGTFALDREDEGESLATPISGSENVDFGFDSTLRWR
jgi:site-specific DNA recombinase